MLSCTHRQAQRREVLLCLARRGLGELEQCRGRDGAGADGKGRSHIGISRTTARGDDRNIHRPGDGADQFELYQTFHDSDVENSAWRFLCMARDQDVTAARKSMLEIKNDTRVPMMEIYEMYRGHSTPEKVLEVARAGEPSEQQLNRSLFYAHLYIGLFHEANGEKELAEKHLRAAVDHKIDHYMWNVADVHVKRLKERGKK